MLNWLDIISFSDSGITLSLSKNHLYLAEAIILGGLVYFVVSRTISFFRTRYDKRKQQALKIQEQTVAKLLPGPWSRLYWDLFYADEDLAEMIVEKLSSVPLSLPDGHWAKNLPNIDINGASMLLKVCKRTKTTNRVKRVVERWVDYKINETPTEDVTQSHYYKNLIFRVNKDLGQIYKALRESSCGCVPCVGQCSSKDVLECKLLGIEEIVRNSIAYIAPVLDRIQPGQQTPNVPVSVGINDGEVPLLISKTTVTTVHNRYVRNKSC